MSPIAEIYPQDLATVVFVLALEQKQGFEAFLSKFEQILTLEYPLSNTPNKTDFQTLAKIVRATVVNDPKLPTVHMSRNNSTIVTESAHSKPRSEGF